jgi:DNA-directed RNA polymerase specialized sigma54-like protein
MRLHPEVIEAIAREVVELLLQGADIDVESSRAVALEVELTSIMREHFVNEGRVAWAARAMLERRGLDERNLDELMQEVAEARGVRVGDAGVEDVVDRLAGAVKASPNVKRVFAPDEVVRDEFFDCMKRHLEVDLDQEVRPRIRLLKPFVMTTQLHRAIKLLQLSDLELLAVVQHEIQVNPFLEYANEEQRNDAVPSSPVEVSWCSGADESPEERLAIAPEPVAQRARTNPTQHQGRDIRPVAFIYKVAEGYRVILNDKGFLKLQIASNRIEALREGVGPSLLKDQVRDAAWFIRSIGARRSTIYRVTKSIARFQRDFLEQGAASIKPLTMGEVAADIGMHESTVRRIAIGKSVWTPQGICELKYFFTRSSEDSQP